MGASAGSSGQALPEDLEGALVALEGVGGQTGSLLSKARDALTCLHGSVFPKAQPPSSLGELAELFGPDASTIADFRREHTVRGSQTTLLMLLGHDFEGDFDRAMSGRPRGPDGKPLPLGEFSERTRELAQKLVYTMEKEVAKHAEKAKKSTSSR